MDGYVKHHLMPIEWTPEGLKEMRQSLGLTQEDIGNILDLHGSSICNIERGRVTDPLKLFAYGTVLERYYALKHGYTPSYRKIGSADCIAHF